MNKFTVRNLIDGNVREFKLLSQAQNYVENDLNLTRCNTILAKNRSDNEWICYKAPRKGIIAIIEVPCV